MTSFNLKKINVGDKTVYQYGSFEPTLDPSYISLDNTLKGQEIFALPLIHNLKYFVNSGGFAEIFAVHSTEVTAALLHDLAALLTPLNQKLSGVKNIAKPN